MSFIRSSAIVIVIQLLLSIHQVRAQSVDPPFIKYMNHPWVDSVLSTLTIEQQIAQSVWVACWSDRDISHEVEIVDQIKNYGIGGIVFFQGTAEKQAELTNYYQKISGIPLLICTDAEWGVGMRLDNVEKFPYQMTLGAIVNDSLIYRLGSMVASQLSRLGIHINFAPVADININPENPVINYRSFGEEREKVASKTLMYMKGMQDNGVMATAKHFPGHGDTETDSHHDLPVINHPKPRLDSVELYPFRHLINNGIGCVMTAHLNLPSLDTSGLPSSLSEPVVNNLLKNRMGFKGLIITDAMNMEGVKKQFTEGETEAKALQAGNDVVEFVTDIEKTINETKRYINSGQLTEEDLTDKCRKILALKYWAGLNEKKVIETENITEDLSPAATKALIRDLYANAITVLNNDQNILPLKNLEKITVATIAVNRNNITPFQHTIEKYMPADHFLLDPSDTSASAVIMKKIKGYDIVIAGIFGLDQRPQEEFGINPGLRRFMDSLSYSNKRSIITWFGNPYALNSIKSLNDSDGLILAYQENNYTEELTAQLIFGGIGSRGLLPVTINERWPAGFGIMTPGNIRLQYGYPENAGMSSEILRRKIDSLVDAGLTAKAFPGCEVMAARKGIVVFQKSYGYHTYDNRIPVLQDDLYDLASVTKITAALPGLMLLHSEGKFSPDNTLEYYIPGYKHSDKGDLVIRDMLTHQSGLPDWIPFWKKSVRKNGELKRRVYDTEYSRKFPYKVADGLYIRRNYSRKIFSEIKRVPLGKKEYLYSDLPFIIAPEIIENLTGERWYQYVTEKLYNKIGAFNTGFNPYGKYPLIRIVPTERDTLFRGQLLHGNVHDECAAMLGGISGHAGLFSTTNDLMKLLELYRRMGEYGGEQLIAREVMEEYTSVQYPGNDNRRGVGFDKPLLNNSELPQSEAYPTSGASPSSFGHSGYTGTFVWIDPEYEIDYVFLSNRVYPTRENNRIIEMNIRTEVLQSIYDSIR